MQRVLQPQAEVVAEALTYVPSRLEHLAGCDVFCGDPIFAGIFAPPWDNEMTDDGRSYRSVCHVGYPFHVRDRRTSMVLPSLPSVYTVLHEFGHVLHYALFERGGKREWPGAELVPITKYAKTNQRETFAEAFVGWFYTPKQRDRESFWLGYERANDEFFDRLLRD